MSEGELKKRIFGASYTMDQVLDAADSAIDEAAKEYPTEANTDIPIMIPHVEKVIVLTAKRQEWFLKWFGEQK